MSPHDKRPPRGNPRDSLANGPAAPAPTPGATTTTPKPAPQPCPLPDGDCTTPPDVITGG